MKIDSFKIIKYIFYILCIISLFLSIKTRVNADTIDMDYLSNHSTGNRQYNFTSQGGGQVDFTVNFDTSNMQVKDYSYIQGNIYVINKTQSKTNASTQNINWVETCTSHTDNGTTYGNNGRIVYADGTTAQIDFMQRTWYCNKWNTTGTVSNNDIQFNFDNSPSIQLMVRTNQSNELPCEVNDTIFKCPIGQYEQLNYIKVRVLPKGAQSDYWVSFSNVIYKFKDASSVIINNQNNINQSITDTNNTLKDSSIDSNSTSSSTSNWGNMNTSNGVITNLLTLPIQLMQGYVNGLNSSCSPFNLGNLFGTNITLPCINIGNLIGSSLWGVIDVLFSGFMIFGIAKKLIKIFNDFTNMRGNQVDELYGGGA